MAGACKDLRHTCLRHALKSPYLAACNCKSNEAPSFQNLLSKRCCVSIFLGVIQQRLEEISAAIIWALCGCRRSRTFLAQFTPFVPENVKHGCVFIEVDVRLEHGQHENGTVEIAVVFFMWDSLASLEIVEPRRFKMGVRRVQHPKGPRRFVGESQIERSQ